MTVCDAMVVDPCGCVLSSPAECRVPNTRRVPLCELWALDDNERPRNFRCNKWRLGVWLGGECLPGMCEALSSTPSTTHAHAHAHAHTQSHCKQTAVVRGVDGGRQELHGKSLHVLLNRVNLTGHLKTVYF